MNKKIWFVGGVLLAGITTFSYLQNDSTSTSEEIVKVPKQKPNDEFFKQRAYPTGKIDYKTYFTALKERDIDAKLKSSQAEQWEFLGPTNTEGRIVDIEITTDATEKLYIGSASGGIFTSDDGGTTWQTVFDDQSVLSIGDIALAPSNEDVVYVGTGEANAGGGSLAYDGNGIYKSENGGTTWTHLGLESIGSVGKVLVHPTDPNTAYAGGMGYLFENNPERGVYKTTDGGSSWEKVFYLNDSTGVIDMAINPVNPDTLYAASWERIRRVNRRSYGGESSGIHRSVDGGATWQELTNGLPTTAGRIGIAIAPSSPNKLYAFYTHETTGNIKGVYVTNDHGENWTSLSTNGLNDVPYMWWFSKVFVDPANDSTVYIAGIDMHKSVNGGSSWTTIFPNTHADQHALAVSPSNSNKLFLGNDGGAFLSSNQGSSFSKLEGLPITQFYTCEVDEQNIDKVFGGTQDNGTITSQNNWSGWSQIFGGDGFRVLVDPNNSNNVYAEAQYGYLGRSTNGGANFYVGTNGISSVDRKNWNTPVVFDPNNSSVLYYGSNKLYKTTNKAMNWTAISPDLTGNPTQSNLTFGTITAISASKADGQVIWVGTDNGKVQTTTNGGSSWTEVSGLPNRWVTSVTAHPEHEEEAYVTFSGYRWNENQGHVFFTPDGGSTWEDVSGDLPDVPVNDFIITPVNHTYYVATDIGVYYSTNAGQNWEYLGNQLPKVVVTDIRFHEGENRLFAATFGRGMYGIDVDESNNVSVDDVKENEISVYPNPFVDQVTVKGDVLSVEIFNASGKLLQQTKETTINVSDLPNGTYWFKITGKNEANNTVRKLVK
jgi:photosystem II stability/assembly factor-like uncharacterized protein